MLIVGTAGHIDHGKSSIVHRLTDVDPDRLPEEKARGMTIDLGFAFYDTPGGETVGFVDVPGHERFVKNMIAGAGGIDTVMLVVAADDGWMPQSQEHFQVVRLLGVRHGFVVINKCDLVDRDWLELLEEEVKDKVAGSFLEGAPMFTVSAATGEGFDQLRAYLDTLPERLAGRADIGKPRLYVDRSFVRPGMGGVVTGTLRGGRFSVGQNVRVWPSGRSGKIRALQTNNRNVDTAYPGQRTAMGFTGIDKEDLVRGGVVVPAGSLRFQRENPVLALDLELVAESPVVVKNRRRLLVIIGTTEMEGEVRLYGAQEQLLPGGRGIVFFRPDEPMYALVADAFIARLPTPMVTIGGGRVLGHLAHFPRRRHMAQYAFLEGRQTLEIEALVVSELRRRVVKSLEQLLVSADVSSQQVRATVDRLVEQGVLGRSGGMIWEHVGFQRHVDELVARLSDYLQANPHVSGLTREQVQELSPLPLSTTEVMLRALIESGQVVRSGDKYNLVGRGQRLEGAVKQAYDEIMGQLQADRYAPPSLSNLAKGSKPHREAIRFLLESGLVHKCGSEFLFLSEVWREIVEFIAERLEQSGELSVAELRERFGFTRKFAIPILEETDRIGLTRREGDVRVKGDHGGDESTVL
jgi:selenocysteine-specific elongation factor